MKWLSFAVIILIIINIIQYCSNHKNELERIVNVSDLRVQIDTLIVRQDSIIEKQVFISKKAKTLVRIKEIHDTTKIIEVCLIKENLLDSLVIVSDSLVNSILGMNRLRDKQDSLLFCKIDSLEKSPKKYFRGFKHGIVLGVIVGIAIPRR